MTIETIFSAISMVCLLYIALVVGNRLNNMTDVGKEMAYGQWESNHMNCRCSFDPSQSFSHYNYISFISEQYPNASKIYVDKVGHICIVFKKSEFSYTTSLNDIFLQEFGRMLELVQIYESDGSLYVVLDVGGARI